MKNMVKSELYRLFTTKIVWALLILYLVFSVINGCLTGLVSGNATWLVDIKSYLMDADVTGGSLEALMKLMQTVMTGEVVSFDTFLQANVGSNLMLVVAIFVGVFCLAQKSTGYIKNLMPLKSRSQILGANILSTVLFTLILDILYLGAMILAWLWFFNGAFLDSVTWWYLLLMVVISIVDAIFIYSICDMFKNPKTGMIIAVIYTAGFSKYLYKIIDVLFSALKVDFKIEMLLPFGLLSAITPTQPNTIMICSIAAAAYGILSFVYLHTVNMKRDY